VPHKFVLDHVVIDHFLTEEESPVWGALDALATQGVDIAKQLAPVSSLPQDTPGELRDSITKVLGAKKSGKPVAYVGTNVPYGVYQEFGTVDQPGTPFLRPMLQRLDASRAFGGLAE
jgi:HK97 gp10 family phage protein